jgi:DNA-binding NarL/FixJ family response regulator
MDIAMPTLNGLEATKQIKEECPEISILVLTVHCDSEHIIGILEAGASGYLTKSVFEDEVVQAIRSLVAGETVLSPQVFHELLKHAVRHPTKLLPIDEMDSLSSREQEILQLAGRGLSNKDIAQQLNLSATTVKSYFVDIFDKLKVGSRTEAVITALRIGCLSLDDLNG